MRIPRTLEEHLTRLIRWPAAPKSSSWRDSRITSCARFEIYDAKWTEHPSARDASVVRRVAADLPRNTVLRQGVICRTPNAYPLGDGVDALPSTSI